MPNTTDRPQTRFDASPILDNLISTRPGGHDRARAVVGHRCSARGQAGARRAAARTERAPHCRHHQGLRPNRLPGDRVVHPREAAPLVSDIAAAHGAEATGEYGDSYPVTDNDADEAALALEVLQDLHGRGGAQFLSAPLMATEDFSYVLEQVPGALVVLGARPADVPAAGAPGMRSASAVFDDGVLGRQAEALAEIAWRGPHAG